MGPRGWRDLITAQFALLRAQWRVWREPVGTLVIRDEAARERPSGDTKRARELALAVERTAAFGLFRPYCLVRAIALRELLAHHGIRGSNIHVGVRRMNGEFNAHAWVRLGEEILGDRPEHVASFTEVDDMRVLRRP